MLAARDTLSPMAVSTTTTQLLEKQQQQNYLHKDRTVDFGLCLFLPFKLFQLPLLGLRRNRWGVIKRFRCTSTSLQLLLLNCYLLLQTPTRTLANCGPKRYCQDGRI